jgi:nucleotide-binding universal stress UspA family protein
LYNKVLAPLDGSEMSECTLEHIKIISNGCGTDLVTLILVVESGPTGGVWESTGFSFSQAQEEAIRSANQYLSKIGERLAQENIKSENVVMKGNPADTILDYANQHDFDLIIMSTHGRSGPSRWAFGSVTEKVLRMSTIPVLSISPPGCVIRE